MGGTPLVTSFSLVGGPVPTRVELDVDGDGSIDFSGATLEGQTFTYPTAGLYFPVVRVIDSQGAVSTARAVVQVLDRADLETLLQPKWTALRNALGRADVPAAVALFASEELERRLGRRHGDQFAAAQHRERHPPARGEPLRVVVGLGADRPDGDRRARPRAGVLVLGVCSVVLKKTPEAVSGLTIGAALALGATLASGVSGGIVNPAVAIGVGAVSWTYLLGPLLGGIVVATVYKGIVEMKK